MRDRVPGAPGQYQAVITPQEQAKLMASEPFVLTLTRDDHPITEGTPYSKAAVLPDALAASLCPNLEDPTPADAFAALHEKALESEEFPGCYYRIVGSEMEWWNPPLVLGEEYRTTQRYNGKTVYEKAVDLGAVPTCNAGEPGYKWTNIGVNADKVVCWEATIHRRAGQVKVNVTNSLPYVAVSTGKVIANLFFNGDAVALAVNENIDDAVNVELVVRYTKEVL